MGNDWKDKAIKIIIVVMKAVVALVVAAPTTVTEITPTMAIDAAGAMLSLPVCVPDTVRNMLQVLPLTLLHKEYEACIT